MTPQAIINNMYGHDAFSRWLGIKILEIGEGFCKLSMTIRPEMCNGFGIAHGGVTYAFADSALAFASNSRGRKAVSIETSISHTKMLHPGNIIIATAKEKNAGNTIAIYEVTVTTEAGELAALFKGTVYRMGAFTANDIQ